MNEYRIRWYDRCFRLDRVFMFAGKRFRCYADDLAALRFLERLELDRLTPGPAERPRLIHFRRDFRRLAADQPLAALVLTLIQGREESRRLALFLLGRGGNSKSIPIVHLFASHTHRRIRFAAVQALRRLRARAELDEIFNRDHDPGIRQLAAAATRRTFDSQLQRFLADDLERVPATPFQQARQPLLWNISSAAGRPPKSTDIMRAILDRIRHLLRGNGNQPT